MSMTGSVACKSFTIVVYNHNSKIVIFDHNDSGQYFKAMILANKAFARSINYDRKVVCCKLKHNTIVNYYYKTSIVHAIGERVRGMVK